MKKTPTYVLAAEVLLEDPQAIFAYPKQSLVLFESEILKLKKLAGPNAQNANKLLSFLDIHSKTIYEQQAILLDNQATLRVLSRQNAVHQPISTELDELLVSILEYQQKLDLELKTNNPALRIQAAMLHIKASPHVLVKELAAPFEKLLSLKLDLKDATALLKNQQITCSKLVSDQLNPNQHAVFWVDDQQYLCRYKQSQLYLVGSFQAGVWNLKPRNLEQRAALDILLDPKVQLVVLSGKAGTGKTLLALAAGFEQLLNGAGYAKVLVSRPIIPIGRDMGYLPGTVEEKITPWMQPIFDNLDFLQSLDKNSKAKQSQKLLDRRLLELEALTYIRGRSIAGRFMIIDEAQNLTQHEVKTLITRVGSHSKIVLTGDPYQIDSAGLSTQTNGLTYLIHKMQDYELSGHAHLVQGERSELAELASNIL